MAVKYIVCALFVIWINVTDIKGYKIKNAAVLAAIIAGLILSVYFKSTPDSLLGMIAPLVLFPLFALKMLGAGDVKAFCALGAVLGLKQGILLMIFSFIGGGIAAAAIMILNKNTIARFRYLFSYLKCCLMTRTLQKYDFGGGEKSYFRFAYAIAIGFVMTVINSRVNFLVLW